MGLDRTRALLDAVEAPDRAMRGVLVAGTNGKGSTCAFISAVLQEAGLRSAAMPKPHLVSYTERVTIDGKPISEADFAAAVTRMVPAIDLVARDHGSPTEFEILTALALRHARDQGVDLLVCEVGMGGRLDATNVTDLGVKVITGIDLDHMQYLGSTREEIAAEKAGIIRRGDVVVCGALAAGPLEVVVGKCDTEGAALLLAGRDFEAHVEGADWRGVQFDFEATGAGLDSIPGLKTAMLGHHQAANAALAVAAVQAMVRRHGLSIDTPATRAGIAAARWPGRLELIAGAPPVLIDGAHNPAAIETVVGAIRDLGTPGAPVVVFGAMADKDTLGMLQRLPREWPVVFTAVAEERATPGADLLIAAERLGRHGDVVAAAPDEALAEASRRAGPDGMVVVLGSLYLAGAARDRLVVPNS